MGDDEASEDGDLSFDGCAETDASLDDAPELPPHLAFAAGLFRALINHRTVAVAPSGHLLQQPLPLADVAALAAASGAAGPFLAATLCDVVGFDDVYRRLRFAELGQRTAAPPSAEDFED